MSLHAGYRVLQFKWLMLNTLFLSASLCLPVISCILGTWQDDVCSWTCAQLTITMKVYSLFVPLCVIFLLWLCPFLPNNSKPLLILMQEWRRRWSSCGYIQTRFQSTWVYAKGSWQPMQCSKKEYMGRNWRFTTTGSFMHLTVSLKVC